MRYFLSLLALSALAAAAPAMHAATITYTESATGSGIFDGTAFTNALITFSATGSTSNVTQFSSSIFDSILPTTVAVAGLRTDSFTDTIQFVDNQGGSAAGLGDVTSNIGILFTVNPAFGIYDLASSIGPFSGANLFTSGHVFATAGGNFTLNSLAGNSTFQANIPSATSVTPEPSSLVLLATGGIGLAGALRRKLRR